MKIFSGTNSQELSKEISDIIEIPLGKIQIDRFSDGEILPLFRESIRGEDVFFITNTSSSDLIMETLLVIDAAKRSGCKSFTLVSPYMGYSRQDKSDHLRSSIGSKVLADILEKVGMNAIISIDLHASAIQGFYNVPVIHLNGNKIFLDHIKNLNLSNICILAPDQGAVRRASDFCKSFPDATFAMINKKRIKPNEIHSMELVGDVVGKNVIVVDDISDTLGTVKKAADLIMNSGALSVRAITTHGILSGSAIDNLESSNITELIVSDTITQVKKSNKLVIVSCANMIAKSIMAISEKKSIHEINAI
jgi:ribose-phosphate pyrophosphokinase